MTAAVKTKTVDQVSTKQRLLDAAFRVFAEQGFYGATIRHICERADTSIAAVNYHFHGKEKLYKAVLEYACQRIRAQRSLPADRPLRQTPEQKLRTVIQLLFQSLTQESDSPSLIRLLVRELAEQSGGPDCWVAAALRTHAGRLEEPVRELLGPHASRDCIHLCALSVVSQCVFFCAEQSSLQCLCPELGRQSASSDQLIAHVARFAGQLWHTGRKARQGPSPLRYPL
jgi:AcrR family transcriptional regulator